MWISSLVVTLTTEHSQRQQALNAIEAIPVFTAGDSIGDRLPIVVEAEPGDSRHWFEWLQQLPGVSSVEVAFVSFEEVSSPVSTTEEPSI